MLYIIGLIISLTAISSYAERAPNDTCAYPTNNPICDERANTNTTDTCDTAECIYTAAHILRNMNSEVDPCDNFYGFTCGGFVNSTTIPDGATHFNIFNEMSIEITKKLRVSLEKSSTSDIRTISLAKNFYAACMDTATIENVGLQPILNILTQLGSWPVLEGDHWSEDDFDLTRSVQKSRDLGCEYDWVVAVDAIIERTNIPVYVIDVGPPRLDLPTDYLIKGLDDETIQAYRAYMIDMAVMLGADYKTASEQLMESLEFEIALAQLVASSETLEHNLITVADLQKLSPRIKWVDYLNNLLAPNVTIDESEIIRVNVPSYVSSLDTLLANTPKRVQANYFMWRVVDYLSPYSTGDIRKRVAMFDEVLKGRTKTEDRWETCLTVVRKFLPVSIDALYVRNYFADGTKKAVTELVAAVKTELIQVIKKTKWMDDESRTFALDKADSLRNYIAYPEELFDDATLDAFHARLQINTAKFLQNNLYTTRFWTNYLFAKVGTSVDRSDWVINTEATIVNALYNLNQNDLHLPAGILQNPLFGLNRPAYVDFAIIGSITINLMTTAFTEFSSQYDGNGIFLPISWWSAETRAKYQAMADCIVKQYNGYTVESLGLPVNGNRTVERNIADNSGVTIAYIAYKKFVEDHGSEFKLPGLNYTPEQLFWISTANIWCSKYQPDALKTYVESRITSPDEFRVIGPLSNRPEFAEAFNCPVGSRMNPEHKCSVW